MPSEDRLTPQISNQGADIVARVALAALFLGLAYRVAPNALETGRPSALFFLLNELLVVGFTLTRRFPTKVDRSLLARVAAFVGTVGPLLALPDARYVLASEWLVLPLSMVGIAVGILGKLSLGRSLGMLPAHRGIVSSGLYRIVRHPLYIGYFFVHVSFLLSNATPWNAVVFSLTGMMLVVRMDCEERVLGGDEEYQAYMRVVPYRLIPGLY